VDAVRTPTHIPDFQQRIAYIKKLEELACFGTMLAAKKKTAVPNGG
jgi:hypothetical protein